jgi:hypothetical protein
MTSEALPERCAAHGALAGWECLSCQAPLCPDCAAEKDVHPTTVTVCTLCGGFTEPLLRSKREAASLASRLPGAFAFPLRGEGLPAFLAVAAWLGLTSLLGVPGALLGWAGAIAALFGVARSTARGREHLELMGRVDDLFGLAVSVARFAVVLAPAAIGAWLASSAGAAWAWWVAAAVALAWSPTAFIGAVADASFVYLLNPFRVLKTTSKLGADYGVYLGGLFAVGAVMAASLPLAWFIKRLEVPVVSTLLAQPVLLYGPFVAARLAGLVLLLHGPVFGWGVADEAYEPVLPGVAPRGRLPDEPKKKREAIELEVESPAPAPAIAAAHRFAAIELEPSAPVGPPAATELDVALLPSHGEASAREIREAMLRGDTSTALDGFRATGVFAAEALTLEELLWLGQTAGARLELEVAELALAQAAQRQGDAEAVARARVMLGRLLAEKLGRPAEGAGWMERVVAEHPRTQAADFARQWLARRADA